VGGCTSLALWVISSHRLRNSKQHISYCPRLCGSGVWCHLPKPLPRSHLADLQVMAGLCSHLETGVGKTWACSWRLSPARPAHPVHWGSLLMTCSVTLCFSPRPWESL
jgi:hypothetical protein